MKKIKEPYDPKKELQYKKHSKVVQEEIDSPHFLTSSLFSSFLLNDLKNKVYKKSFKSYEIPKLLEELFLFDINSKIPEGKSCSGQKISAVFDEIREKRNKISHGLLTNPSKLPFKDVKKYLKFFRWLAIKIDQHLIKFFFIIEKT